MTAYYHFVLFLHFSFKSQSASGILNTNISFHVTFKVLFASRIFFVSMFPFRINVIWTSHFKLYFKKQQKTFYKCCFVAIASYTTADSWKIASSSVLTTVWWNQYFKYRNSPKPFLLSRISFVRSTNKVFVCKCRCFDHEKTKYNTFKCPSHFLNICRLLFKRSVSGTLS